MKENNKTVTENSTAPVVAKKKEKKPSKIGRFFKGIGRKFREIFLELKKVTWPSFGKAAKETGVVLLVCLGFLIVLTLFDLGLGELVRLITSIGGN